MGAFSGFPTKLTYTSLPDSLFSSLLPEIEDIAELRVTLHLVRLLCKKRAYPRFATKGELLEDRALVSSLGAHPVEELSRGLGLALKRGTFLHLALERDEGVEELLFLNTDANKGVVERIRRGELNMGARPMPEPQAPAVSRPNIFALYEENIGLLTPIIAEELKEAERLYPASWIEDAFKLAVRLNRRRWQTVAKILERWATEGKDDGKPGRDSKKDADPGRSWKERYPGIVRE